ncbi:MAG TPA: TetR/AcrR family transcriptional regulator [Gemmataceae bacterium]|nr:TetR/AcrR family transcriptional regulator [Gemmataceae bacterium]
MNTSRVSAIRREQIIEAAIAVIDEQGIQHLSLSEIEKKTGLARGQLMYYYRSKEDILLAVFDRLLQMIHAHAQADQGHANGHGEPCGASGAKGWERLQQFLTGFVLKPPMIPAFHSLHYTFLSQIRHREDFRERLANLYGTWRVRMAEHLATETPLLTTAPDISPRAVATLVQAILHGLSMQRTADPDAFDAHEMLRLVLNILAPYLNPLADESKKERSNRSSPRRKAAKASRPLGHRPRRPKKVKHE